MSDTLTTDDVIAFLVERRRKHNCPSCGEDALSVNNWKGALAIYNLIDPIRTLKYPAVIVTCQHCAYTMPYSYFMIYNWKKYHATKAAVRKKRKSK